MFGGGSEGIGAALLAAQLYGQAQLILMALSAFVVLCPLQAHEWTNDLTWPKALALAPAFGLAVTAMFSQAFNPFLYFQF
jgi:alginate O-acetyltransferase complex protein AlgI